MGVDMVHSGFCSNGFSSHIVDGSNNSDDEHGNNHGDNNSPRGNQERRTLEAWSWNLLNIEMNKIRNKVHQHDCLHYATTKKQSARVKRITCKPCISVIRGPMLPSAVLFGRCRVRGASSFGFARLALKRLRNITVKAQVFRREGLLGKLPAESFPGCVWCSTLCRNDKEKIQSVWDYCPVW